VQCEISNATFGWAAWEACSATWENCLNLFIPSSVSLDGLTDNTAKPSQRGLSDTEKLRYYTEKCGSNESNILVDLRRLTRALSEARGSIVVKALCYKPEGRGFDTR
jgi:hypothetical protein